MVEITDSMRNNKNYNGNTRKFGVTLNGVDYIVKFSKNNDMSVYCEYIASEFIRSLGISCHEVTVGVYKGEIVNIIKDFTSNEKYSLHSYKDTKQTSEDTDIGSKEYTYNDILYLIDKHLKLSDKDKELAKKSFWNMFIVDAILGNRDRHWGNWGYLAYKNRYNLAPLYDNGASLYPNVNNVIISYINEETRYKFLYERVFTFPASLFKIKKEDRCYRSNYYEMFSDLRVNKIFASQVKTFRLKYDYKEIYSRIYNIVNNLGIPIEYKRFYVEIVTLRYMCIIERKDFSCSYRIVERMLNK